jgi:putative PEP-CTERM system TPR-repeat lipoprotein
MKKTTSFRNPACGALLLALALPYSPAAFPEPNTVAAHLARGEEFVGRGDYKAAVIEIKNALQVDPSNAEARRELGRIYLQTGDAKSAEKELRRALLLGSSAPDLRLDLAEALVRDQRFDEAREFLEPSPEGDAAQQARAVTLRGYVEAGGGDTARARASFEQALQLDPVSREAAMGLVKLDLQGGDPQVALSSVEKLLKSHPGDVDSLLIQGELLRKLGRRDEALQAFDQVLEADGRNTAALLGRVAIHLSRKNTDAAQADLKRVDDINSDIVMARYFHAVLAFEGKRLEEAREHVQAVLGAVPGHAPSQLLYGLVGYALGDYEVAEEFLGRFGPDSPAYHITGKALGAIRLKENKPERAIEILEPLARKYPDDMSLLQLLGVAYLQNGDHDKSAQLLQKVVEMQPDTARYRAQLALGLLGSGKTEEAVGQLQSAVELDAGLVQADILMVTAHLRSREFNKALETSLALEKRLPDNPVAYNLTGLVYLTQNDLDKAAQRFGQALSVDPKFVTAETNLARIDLARKDYKAAEQRYRRVLELAPGNQVALIGLAGIAEVGGDAQAARRWLESAVEKNPEQAQPPVLLARYHLKSKEPLKALSVANAAASRLPDNPAVLEILAAAQGAAGEKNNAVRTLQRLVTLAPSETTYLQLAAAQVAIEDLRGARASVQEALRLNPASGRAKLTLASIALEQGNYNETLLLARELQQAYPKLEMPHRLEAETRLKMGEPDQAMAAFERALGIQPTVRTVQQLANLYEQKGRTADAIAVMLEWIGANPDDLPTRMVLAVSYQKWGRNDEAIAQYEAILQRDPGNAVVLNNLAWLYHLKNDSRALATAEQAYGNNSERAEIADTYGWILFKQGNQPAKALSILQEAYVRDPANREIGYHVAEALHAAGRNDEALRTLRNLLDGGAQFPQRADAENLRRRLQRSGG